jgi:hypothetical protein
LIEEVGNFIASGDVEMDVVVEVLLLAVHFGRQVNAFNLFLGADI